MRATGAGHVARGRRAAATCGRRPPPLPTVSLAPRTFTELARGRGAAGRRARTLAGIRRTLVEVRSAFHVALVQSRWGAYPVKLPGLAGGTLAIGRRRVARCSARTRLHRASL